MSHCNIICTTCGMVIANEYEEVKRLFREKASQLNFYDLNQKTVNTKEIFQQINERRFKENLPRLSPMCCEVALLTNVNQEEFILPVPTQNQKTYPNLPLKIEPSHPEYDRLTGSHVYSNVNLNEEKSVS